MVESFTSNVGNQGLTFAGGIHATYTDYNGQWQPDDATGKQYFFEEIAFFGVPNFDTTITASFLGCGPSVSATSAFASSVSANGQDTHFTVTLHGSEKAGVGLRWT